MTRTILTSFDAPGLGELTHPRDIEGEEWERMIRAGHWLYAREGARVPSLVPTTGRGLTAPDYAETTNTSYNQINEAAGAELEQREGQWRLTRLLVGFTAHRIRVRAYGQGIDARLQWAAIDEPGLYSGQVTLSFGASPEWKTATLNLIPPVELLGGTGPTLRLVRAWLTHRLTGSSGRLYQYVLKEDQVIADSDLATE